MFYVKWPCIGVITSGYGLRLKPKAGMHYGIDIANKAGTEIKACYKGIIQHAGQFGGYGIAIIIKHPSIGQVFSLYGHLSAALVNVGQEVKEGEIIGKMGSTGYSTGPHLHFETRVGGNWMIFAKNPIKYLPEKMG